MKLGFSILDAQAKRYTASPAISFRLRIQAGMPVDAIVLRAQIRIEPQWRKYAGAEQAMLSDLFGEPQRWDKTLHALAWADIPVMVPGFTGEKDIDLTIPCTIDFDQAATRFFSALGDGEIPLRFFFSGSIYRRGEQAFSVEMVSWSSECGYRLPLSVWRDAMAACYGDAALIRIDREIFERLHRYRTENGCATWDATLEKLFSAAFAGQETAP